MICCENRGDRTALGPFAARLGLRCGWGSQARRPRRVKAGDRRLRGAGLADDSARGVAAASGAGGSGRPYTGLHRLVGRCGGACPSAVGWLASLSAAQVAGLVLGLAVLGVLAAQGWLLLNLLRQNGRLLMRVDTLEWRLGAGGVAPSPNGVEVQPPLGLPLGDTAPEFELPGLHRETLTLESLRTAGKPIKTVFTE